VTRARSALIGLAIALPVAAAFVLFQQTRSASLPVYWTVPAFSLLDQDSASFGQTDLSGRAWLVSFAYTHCPDVCPLVTQRMAELRDVLKTQEALGEVRLLTITVDPQRDTPAVLRSYAQQWRGTKPDWFFITGEPDAVFDLINRGFRLTLMHPARQHDSAHVHAPDAAGNYMVSHTDRIVLVDQESQVRGTYAFSDPESKDQLIRDLRGLR
jgi:protein SCO1